ncbi:hypothetical protein ACHAPJ_006997 [Fusarium lateritium]
MLQCATTAGNAYIQLDPQRPALPVVDSKDRTSSSAELLCAAVDEILHNGLMKPAIRHNDEWKEPVHKLLSANLVGVGKNAGKPVDFLCAILYKSQATLLKLDLEMLVDEGILSAADRRRIKVYTLDEAQGDECDIVLVDFVLTGNPGFIAAESRIALTLNRVRVITILFLKRGTFSGWEMKNTVQKHALQFYIIHNFDEKHGLDPQSVLREVRDI